MKLEREFYLRDGLTVARELIGKKLICRGVGGIITETEAYMGAIDKAAHSYKGLTKRTEVIFNEGGHLYIYLIYGMYHCLNVVANVKGIDECVLIRAIEPTDGIELMKIRRHRDKNLCDGPGKLTQALNITIEDYNADLCGEEIYIEETNLNCEVETSKRINIDYSEEAKDFLWRFILKR